MTAQVVKTFDESKNNGNRLPKLNYEYGVTYDTDLDFLELDDIHHIIFMLKKMGEYGFHIVGSRQTSRPRNPVSESSPARPRQKSSNEY